MFTAGPQYPDTFVGRLRQLGSPLARTSRPIDHLLSPLRRPLDRAWYAYTGKLRELRALGTSVSRMSEPANGTRVLVLALRMWMHHAACESVVAQALRLRGADVTMLTCGGGQPICEVGWGRLNAPRPCDRCAFITDRLTDGGALPRVRLADEFPWGPSPASAPAEPRDARHIEGASMSAAWFTKSSDAATVHNGTSIQRDFDVSAEAVTAAFAGILDRVQPDVVFALNGLFAAEHAVRSVALDRGIRVVTYEMAPRKDALVFGQPSVAPDMMMDGLAEDQCARPLSPREDAALEDELQARVTGEGAHERYFEGNLEHEAETVRKSLKLRSGVRVVSAFTNLAWDTALLGKDIAFESQFDWLARASEAVAHLDDTALVVRAHPAESRWGTAQPVEAELLKRVGRLPPNVILVRPDDPLSSYGLLEISDLVLAYTTTVGLEAAVRGISVAVGGTTHYRGRGFTIDIDSVDTLGEAIADPPEMSPEQIELARRYAFAFFFRRMIPFRHVRSLGARVVHVPESAEELLPGRDPYLDFVCNRILDGGEFFLPSELALPAAT
jgi:hypothetical protein